MNLNDGDINLQLRFEYQNKEKRATSIQISEEKKNLKNLYQRFTIPIFITTLLGTRRNEDSKLYSVDNLTRRLKKQTGSHTADQSPA